MLISFLHTASSAYDLPTIICRAWTRAWAEVVICTSLTIVATLWRELAKATKAATRRVPHDQFSAISLQNRTTLKTLDGLMRADTPC